ncbi:MAG: hypothetical protein IJI60_05275 [Bacilli bacterium]|nr:hypothetical protein [Bacilli bacterium]
MNCSENSCSSCIFDILKRILLLQKQDFDHDNFVGCDKPFLGPSTVNVTYNTRPIQLFNSSTGDAWTFDYTLASGTTGESNVLRVESLDDCCCTCRILYLNTETNTYVSTGQFVTIDLHSCGAIRCLSDTYVELA